MKLASKVRIDVSKVSFFCSHYCIMDAHSFTEMKNLNPWGAFMIKRKFSKNPCSVAVACAVMSMCSVSGVMAEGNSLVLEEIVVTATKRETNLMETPVAVSAFNQKELQRQGIKSARDLAGRLPNVQLGTGSDSGTATTVRGVTSTDFTEVGESAVSYHIDGSYSPRPQGALALMHDLEQVEVVRGPQGTLFGMNSPGGSINIIPAKPVFEETFGSLEGELGSYKGRQVRGMLNLGLTETFALRGTFMIDQRDGMMQQGMDVTDIESLHNGILKDGIPDVDQRRNRRLTRKDFYNNSDQWGARLIANWTPSDDLSVTGTYEHYSDNGAGDIEFVDCAQAAGTVNACTNQLRYANINVPGEKDLDVDDFRIHVNYSLSDNIDLDYRGSFQNMTRSQISDYDGGAHPAAEWSDIGEAQTAASELTGYYPIHDDIFETVSSDYETTSHEFQIKSTGDGPLQYVAGIFLLNEEKQIRYDIEMLNVKTYYEDDSLPLGFNPDGLPDTWVFDQNKRTTESKAVFAQFDYEVNEKVTLTAGFRQTEDKKTDQGGVTHAFWWGNEEWYNGEHTPTSIRGHQSNDLTFNMGGLAPLGTVLPASDPNHVQAEWKEGTYRLGSQYFIDDDQMMFASVATGYKMGGMYETFDVCNNGCIELLQYDPEYVKTFEIGYKGTLFEERVRLSVTGFFSDYTDMQNTGEKPVGIDEKEGSVNFGDVVNAYTTDNLSAAEIKGLEIEFDAIPWENGRFSGYAAWLDTEIIDDGTFQDGYACAEREIYGQSLCTAPESNTIVGNSLPFAPEFSITLNYEHTIDLESGFTLTPYVSVHWQDDMFLDVRNYDGQHLSQKQEAYTKVDASIRLDSPDGDYYVSLNASNLTDEDTKNFGSFNRGRVKASYDAPRLFALRMGYNF